jgi:hypothetical protein
MSNGRTIADLAAADAKGELNDAEASAWLRSAEVLPEWQMRLVELKKNLEHQSAEFKQLIGACPNDPSLVEKRSSILRVLQGVEIRLQEAKRLRKADGDDLMVLAKRIAEALERIADVAEGAFEGGISCRHR